jgi:cation diffusion facilitator CzcD-associated flavoprotein CzcO
MKRIAIIGGGISGLSSAYALEQKRRDGVEVEYVLFEAARVWGEFSSPNTSTVVWSKPAPIPSSPKNPGPATSAASSAWATS